MSLTHTHIQWLLGKAATLFWHGVRTTMVTYLLREMVEWTGAYRRPIRWKGHCLGYTKQAWRLSLLSISAKMNHCLGALMHMLQIYKPTKKIALTLCFCHWFMPTALFLETRCICFPTFSNPVFHSAGGGGKQEHVPWMGSQLSSGASTLHGHSITGSSGRARKAPCLRPSRGAASQCWNCAYNWQCAWPMCKRLAMCI